MVLTRRVALNGVWLDDVDSRIVISSVEPGDGKENISAVDTASGYGQRITGNRRSTLDIIIKFRMLEHGKNVTGLQQRAELLEKINAWARAGGYLTANYKPDRRIGVILVQAPGEGSLWDYTKEFTMTFRAYTVPYWEQETLRSITFGGSSNSGAGNATVEGSAPTQMDVNLQNTSGQAISYANVVVDNKTLYFNNLGLGAGETLVIDHNDGLLRIRIRSSGGAYRSAMALRHPDSVDDFLVEPGARGCSFAAQRACRMTVSWRGRYL